MPRYIIIESDNTVMDGATYPDRKSLFTAMLWAASGSEIWELSEDAGRRVTSDMILAWLDESSDQIAAHKADGRLPELAERRVSRARTVEVVG